MNNENDYKTYKQLKSNESEYVNKYNLGLYY
jgi:hypothetical protein